MPLPHVQPLESVARSVLGPLLDEEAASWERELFWSFEGSRQRLESALLEGAIHGFVATDEFGACAYATYSSHEDQGVIGSIFSAQRSRDLGLEEALIGRILGRIMNTPPRLVDCQTLFSSKPGLREPFASSGFESAPRLYMSLDRETWAARAREQGPKLTGGASKATHRLDIRSVSKLVFEAHENTRSMDGSSSFDTLESCTRILRQIILDGVCGPFDSGGSRRIEARGSTVAACLLTWPMREVAHISEVATAREARRLGLARQCLTESLASAFGRGNATRATLSVTASNHAALGLYESLGFAPLVRYHSHVFRRLWP
jgi:ribosomal protein S18 acetylase RimI-like enzyme